MERVYPYLDQASELNVLIVDGGMRGQALRYSVERSARAGHIAVTGFTPSAYPHEEVTRVLHRAYDASADLVIVGQDAAIAAGVADACAFEGIACFAPTAQQARLETSKSHTKELAEANAIPSAAYAAFENTPDTVRQAHLFIDELGERSVVKDDGLASGKGVIVNSNNTDGHRALDELFAGKHSNEGRLVVIEEYLDGRERSGHAWTSYEDYALFPPCEDHKQLQAGDKGPNTGGMGAVLRPAWLDPAVAQAEDKAVMEMIISAYPDIVGVSFPGFKGGKLLEVNMRFGSPEWEAYCRVLDSDFLEHVVACVNGRLGGEIINWSNDYALSLVGAAPGYPLETNHHERITGLEEARQVPSVEIFLGNVALEYGELYSKGKRLFAITSRGPNLRYVRQQTLAAMDMIRVGGKPAVYREDIGMRPLHGYQN